MLTGQSAHSSGMIGLAHTGFALRDPKQHLLHTLRRVGYKSVLAGIQHIAALDKVESLGFDEILNPDEPERSFAAHVTPAVEAFFARLPDQPFFLDAGFFETHRKYPPHGPAEDPRWTTLPPLTPDTPETRQDMTNYKGSARVMDEAYGRILHALEANGLSKNTLVICTTDHGLPLPGMKCNLTDHGTGVLLILRGPGVFGGGKVLDGMVSQMDLFPTLCEWLQIEPPSWLQGQSLMPLLRGERAEVNDALFSEVTFHADYEPMRAVRTRRWKYIRRFDTSPYPVPANCDASPAKRLWTESGWLEEPLQSEQLYDLMLDPQEARNRVGDADKAGVLAEMRGRLDDWMRATDDPLLRGPVAAPPGVKLPRANKSQH